MEVDNKIIQKFELRSEEFKLLTLSKEELEKMIPKSDANINKDDPNIEKIKVIIYSLKELKRQREKIIESIISFASQDNIYFN